MRAVLESVGASLDVMYWMFGKHDGIAIVDAPDSLTMAAVSATVSSTGAISSETHELFSAEEVHQILDTARGAAAGFRRVPGSDRPRVSGLGGTTRRGQEFPARRRAVAVAGVHDGLGREREESGADRLDDRREVAELRPVAPGPPQNSVSPLKT